MSNVEIFRLAPDSDVARIKAERLFASWRARLAPLLPDGTDICHVGATSVPGCLTKGDLDIAVRVPPEAFAAAEACLAALLQRNDGSVRTTTFAAFMDETADPPLGIQLTTIGGAYDDFHRFVARIRASPRLLRAYNNLKLSFNGHPMADYQRTKGRLIAEALSDRSARN